MKVKTLNQFFGEHLKQFNKHISESDKFTLRTEIYIDEKMYNYVITDIHLISHKQIKNTILNEIRKVNVTKNTLEKIGMEFNACLYLTLYKDNDSVFAYKFKIEYFHITSFKTL